MLMFVGCFIQVVERFQRMNYVVRHLIIFSFFVLTLFSIESYASKLVIAPVTDVALHDLLIRTMFVDKKKRVYIGTDSGQTPNQWIWRIQHSLISYYKLTKRSKNHTDDNEHFIQDNYLG
jgi:hypothetical protein